MKDTTHAEVRMLCTNVKVCPLPYRSLVQFTYLKILGAIGLDKRGFHSSGTGVEDLHDPVDTCWVISLRAEFYCSRGFFWYYFRE